MEKGETYGALTLKYKEGPYWICECACGNQKVTAHISNLKNGIYPCCGKCRRLGTYAIKEAEIYRERQKKKRLLKKQFNNHSFITDTPFGPVKSSKGEAEIRALLLAYRIPFRAEYSFGECYPSGGKPFRFDFFVKNQYVIEYDGEEHFKPVACFGGEQGYSKCKWRDNYKNEYCKNNNIPIIRIPYTKLGRITLKDLKPETSEYLIK